MRTIDEKILRRKFGLKTEAITGDEKIALRGAP
jgi:hypothetical protein